MLGTAFFQRFAVIGVWVPLAFMLFLVASMALVGLMQPIPERLIGLPFLVFTLALVAAHVLVLSGVVGLSLLLWRRSPHPKLTFASAVVGLALGLPVLGSIYLHAFSR